jgi:hypothetical protein
MVPDRAGQPTQIQVHITLSQLRGLPGAPEAEAAWAAARMRQPGWLAAPEADAAAGDATLVPIVTAHVDPAAFGRMVEVFLAAHGLAATGPARTPLSPASVARLRAALLTMAADALSGPGGLAAWLRHSALAGGPGGTASLPLDVPLPLDTGETESTIPAHLRRAVTTRHPSCAFPGCEQPASVCQVHHLIPRSEGGPTALHNLVPVWML